MTSDQPRERLISLGAGALSDAELVAIHLGTGRKGEGVLTLARSLLTEWGGVGGLARADVDELSRTPGVGPAKACRLVAAFTLADRISPHDGVTVTTSADIAKIAASRIGRARTEQVLLILMDGGNRVRRAVTVASGGATGSLVPVRDVLALAFRHDAVAIALAHNHPGGSVEPSADDVSVTERLRRACDEVGVRFLDHVVVGGAQWRSVTASR
ncbi:DNA repair protein RadC [Janibacter limosus]|uniref:DNA repair protein RadC n=1 Tax=Janibacter limosus TaxID=53458 RepID=A0A4P6MVY9_9MICO|nr:DNA repair protein RadC [Janibacter limosus]